MPLPEPNTAGAPASHEPDVVFVVHDDDGRVVAASADYRTVARALGSSVETAAPWFAEVISRLAAGEDVVRREDAGLDSGTTIASEHALLSGTADARRMIASRYCLVNRGHGSGPTAAQRLADVLRLSGDWLYETDATLALTFVSDRVFSDVGALPVELIGTRLPDLGVFDGGAGCFAKQEDAAYRRPFADRMADVRHADGTVRRVRFSGVPLFVGNAFVGYRGVARDETRNQSDSDAAMRAESRLTMGLAASRDGFAVFDAHGLLVCANPQIATDLGRLEPLLPGIELGKLLNHALKSGWFVDTDAPNLSATRPSLSNPDGQSMIEVELADGRRVLFCASRTDVGDVLLISTDIGAIGAARPGISPKPMRKSA